MRKLAIALAVVFLVPVCLLADPVGTITSISPTQFFQGVLDQFLTIDGTGLLGDGGTNVHFGGNGLQFDITPSFATPTELIVAVPDTILQKLGKYNVHVQPIDAQGHTKSIGPVSFQVVPAPPPPPQPPVILTPENFTVEATGPTGAIVTYSVTVISVVDPNLAATCTPASGSLFPLGPTNVHCTATDSNGTATADFQVSVVDATAPTLFLPADITTTNTVVTFTATATDIVDGAITPDCQPPSGSTFPIGTTEVVCTATDSSFNVAVGSFFVTVLADTTPPVVTSITASPNKLWPPNHQMVAVTVTVVATDDTDPNPVSQIVSVSSNQPINGTGDGDQAPDWEITGPLTLNLRSERSGNDPTAVRVYTITVITSDASGNATTSTVTVTVEP
jgi:HYR domain